MVARQRAPQRRTIEPPGRPSRTTVTRAKRTIENVTRPNGRNDDESSPRLGERYYFTCPVCGDVDLTPAQVRLVVCSRIEWSYYAFACTDCNDEIRKPADEEIISLLITGGVDADMWEIPAEALEEHIGPAITYDDVLDFVLALEDLDSFAAMLPN